jgi:hypothetical protein
MRIGSSGSTRTSNEAPTSHVDATSNEIPSA